MRIVVVGGGFSGLASAARLAKIGHEVTLLERSERLGGALGRLDVDGYSFDSGPTHTLLPAVVRDLFRKSGRPLERETELVPLTTIREHHFHDGSSLALTGGSRAAQKRALDGLSPGLGEAWNRHVDPYGDVWERLRRDYAERPWDDSLAHPEAVRMLTSRTTLAASMARTLPDARARAVAAHTLRADGHDERSVPAWMGLSVYLEQNFGVWTVPGGIGALGELMASRVRTRKVDVHLGADVLDLLIDDDGSRHGRVRGVRTADGDVPADAVVVAIDPHRLPSLASHVKRRPLRLARGTRSTTLPDLHHLGVSDAGTVAQRWGDDLPGEVVLHGEGDRDSDLVLRPGGTAPQGRRALVVHARGRWAGKSTAALLDALAERGIDLRDEVEFSHTRSSAQLHEEWGGSPLGVQWETPGTTWLKLGPRTPVAGLYAAGAHAAPGSGIPFTGLSAWLVAQCIGPAN